MKKIMLAGSVGSGKTTLTQYLCHEEQEYLKTQAIEFHEYIIDTPGEYMQRACQYNGLIVTAVEAEVIGLVANPFDAYNSIPHSFTSVMNKPVIGIVTHMDQQPSPELQERTAAFLREGGAQQVFFVSPLSGEGMEELRHYLDEEGEKL